MSRKGNRNQENITTNSGIEETHDLVAESFMEGTLDDKVESSINAKTGGKTDEK
ncbi:hypothetical protein [Lottiidibacillus patelloidae]|uniref:hypothetical protein n=1 Tax=Lottiidibacillus patelloidae TaxID=2670334 RepID=UPI0013037DAE|nr:hypothetical protein [Lottiidibacillus patelloidae]